MDNENKKIIKQKSDLWTVPNILTYLRFALVVPFVILFLNNIFLTILKRLTNWLVLYTYLVLVVGLGPTWLLYRWILSPVRLPIPPHKHYY